MRTLLIKEKCYPAYCRNHPDEMPQFSIQDNFGAGIAKGKKIAEDYYNELLSSGVWMVIRDDHTLLIHEKLTSNNLPKHENSITNHLKQ